MSDKCKVETLKQIKNTIDKLNEQKKTVEDSLPELVIYQNDDGTYTRYTRIDNLKELAEKETIFRSHPLSKYSTKIENLKTLPKELKSING